MTEKPNDHSNDILKLEASRLEKVWSEMPTEVKFALRRKTVKLGAFGAIKEIGAHYQNGAWSITAYPDTSGFGSLGLNVSTELYKRLEQTNG